MGSRGEIPAHKPGSWGVIDMVHIPVGAEDISGVKFSILVEIKVVFINKCLQIFGTEIFFSVAECVLRVKPIHPKLIRHQHTPVIRNSPGDPVMAADSLHPPDFPLVIESDSVGFVGSVLFQQRSKAEYAFPGTADVRQYEDNKIFFSDSSGDFFFSAAFCFLILHQRVCSENTGV